MQQKIVELNEVLDYQQPIPYIVKSTDYMEAGDIPVLTAGKTFILGYTKEKTGIFKGPFPVIIFDDFTTATQLVNFPFKVKSSAMKILLPKDNVDIKYIFYFLQIQKFSAETHKRYWISVCAKMKILLPPLAEQKRIVKKIEELFAVIDKTVKSLTETKEQLVQYRYGFLHQIFCKVQGKKMMLEQCVDYRQPTQYIVKSTEYMNSGVIPVLTPGKTFILGYTNEKENIFDNPLPVIIFDDFTTATRFVDFPFKVKSSAMKILLPNTGINIHYVYYAMQILNCQHDTHKRYWISTYGKLQITVPSLLEQ